MYAWWNDPAKFDIFLEYKNPSSFFFILCYFIFSLMNFQVMLLCIKWNMKKTTFRKCGKFWSISLDHFIKHKPLISEECSYYSTLLPYNYIELFEIHIFKYRSTNQNWTCILIFLKNKTNTCTDCVSAYLLYF